MDKLQAARLFHDTYERLAPLFGYNTRSDTKAFDPDSPNGQLMQAVCDEVIAAWSTRAPAQPLDKVIGHKVAKRSGDYQFDGEIIAVIRKRSGELRYAVEDDRGLLLIMNAKQCGLEPAGEVERATNKEPTMDKPKSEPVAWLYMRKGGKKKQFVLNRWSLQHRTTMTDLFGWTETPLYAHPPSTEAEPHRISAEDKDCGIAVEGLGTDEELVEAVARAFIIPLGYSADAQWERTFVGNQVDTTEGTGSLKHLCLDLARAAIPIIRARCEAEVRELREALDKTVSRFEHCAEMIATSHGQSGTLLAERTIKAKHYALEARQALTHSEHRQRGEG